MTDLQPSVPERAYLASEYLKVVKRYAGRDPEGIRVVHAYVQFLRVQLRAAQDALEPAGAADRLAPASEPMAPLSWPERVAAARERRPWSPPADLDPAALNPGAGR